MTADYLVTGGTGFIGLNLVQTLQGERVIVSRDHHNYPWTQKVLERAHVCNGNLNELDFASRVVSRYLPRVIFDLASLSMVQAGLKQPAHIFRNNILATINIMEACRQTDCAELIVHFSTDKVYGEGDDKQESDPIVESGPYETSKGCQELIAKSYAKTYGLPLIIVRGCNAFGQYDLSPRVIPNTIRDLLRGSPVNIFRNRPYHRQYIDVRDLIDALRFIADRPDLKGETINVATDIIIDQAALVKKIVELYEQTVGARVHINEVDSGITELGNQSLNYAKLGGLGWKPKIGLSQGLQDTMGWWKKNHNEILAIQGDKSLASE